MKRKRKPCALSHGLISALLFAGLGGGSLTAHAHHAYAPEFGSSVVSCAEGVITEIHWRSPHIQLGLQLNGRFQQPFEHLTLQSQAPSILRRNYKLEENSIRVGDTIRIRGRISVLGTNVFQMLTLSVNGSEEIALSTMGIPEIGRVRAENTGGDRDLVRQVKETGAAETSVQTQCDSHALY